jgi:hypothetical protein
VLSAGELPPGIVVHRDLEVVQLLCPACGYQHGIEVTERGEPLPHDLKLV